MNFSQAIASCFRNYTTFRGRAGRSEFWNWFLFIILVMVACIFLDAVIFGVNIHDPHAVTPLQSLFSLVLFLPNLAVNVRRLHDIDMSGWWSLILLIPLLGLIVFLIFACRKGTEGENRFGPAPY